MPTIGVDTTVLIDALRGRRAADRMRELISSRAGVVTTAINAEEIVRGLRPKETLHQTDCLIAATAFGVNGTLATGNIKDFPMEGLTVEEWPVGR